MKKQSEYSKKLIKNVTALIASGLILIAATFAWFGLNHRANVNSMSTKMDGVPFTIRYYTADVSNEFALSEGSGTGPMSLAARAALDWEEISSLDVDTLYPGEYNTFKIEVDVGATCLPTVVLDDIRCTSAPTQREMVFKSLYLNILAVSRDGTLLDSESGSLEDLYAVHDGNYYIEALTLPQMESTTFTIYLDIGMTGEDLENTHAALQETGATVTIDSVNIST